MPEHLREIFKKATDKLHFLKVLLSIIDKMSEDEQKRPIQACWTPAAITEFQNIMGLTSESFKRVGRTIQDLREYIVKRV
jgi:hypothetical protein